MRKEREGMASGGTGEPKDMRRAQIQYLFQVNPLLEVICWLKPKYWHCPGSLKKEKGGENKLSNHAQVMSLRQEIKQSL